MTGITGLGARSAPRGQEPATYWYLKQVPHWAVSAGAGDGLMGAQCPVSEAVP